MDKTATTMKAEEAIAAIGKLGTKEEIAAFIVDEERKTILSAAADKLASLGTGDQGLGTGKNKSQIPSPESLTKKQGEQKAPITKDAADFKEGIQKTKSGTGDPGPGAGKGQSPVPSPESQTYITCEDVIAKMRKEGKKI